MRRTITAALFALGLGGATPATAQRVFECSFPEIASNLGWIAPTIAFAVGADGDEVIVNDGIIMGFMGKPAKGEVVADNDKRLTIKWTVRGKDDRNQHATMRYRLSYYKADGNAEVSMQPGSYSNNMRAPGSCQRRKG